ncbi:Ldh family oxidoreductase [Bosea sp. PAMC 26642]|uniref:Ldh family oxidoreductase n=1 Tax=Bosea sp. (strain PAMC 26642) TaxID=1792307 RepID=UPI000770031D|nr:Ldh family oxidoreductase [Bosea sp. PAMC 26642]AMJ59844.1 sulfolactate dehydrogenase [Bosea sp. PAMC 26642]
MTKLSLDQAEARLTDLFTAQGASPANAASVAWALVMAEADGLKGHGLSRVPTYLAMLKSGKIDGRAVPIESRPKPSVLAIDACHGFAYPAIDLAVIELPDLARAQGVAICPIRRSSHCGAAGLHVERLAEEGLVALLFANTPAAIAPWGGSKPVFGTNPIAFAAPLAGREPLVIDMALSKVARGPIVAARQNGETIPEGWALDSAGRPTTDAGAALAGTMLPLGDAKGATLALMVEILAASLVGAHFAFEASSFLDDKGGPPGTGQLILAIDPAAMGGHWFAERMRLLAHAVEDQDGTRLPGVRRLTLRTKAKAEGIEVAEELLGG